MLSHGEKQMGGKVEGWKRAFDSCVSEEEFLDAGIPHATQKKFTSEQ